MVDAQCKLMLDAYACLPNPAIHVTTVDQTVKTCLSLLLAFFFLVLDGLNLGGKNVI